MTSYNFKTTWETEQQRVQQRNGTLSHMDERTGPTALVLNLVHLPLASTVAALEAGSAEAAKEHPGVRVTVVVLRMLSAGFSSVQTDGGGEGGKRGMKGGPPQRPGLRPRYGSMENGSVLLHSYELINKKGTYTKGGLSESFICLSPGLQQFTSISAPSARLLPCCDPPRAYRHGHLHQGLRQPDVGCLRQGVRQRHRLVPGSQPLSQKLPPPCSVVWLQDDCLHHGGQLAVVQFGTRSMSSTAVESGNMLDIKTMCPLTEGTLDAPRLLPAGLLCRTMAEASARREAFLAGAEVCETKREVRLQFLPTRPP